MAGKGGARIGAGRKSKAEELRIRDIAIESITEVHGGLKEGFVKLLKSMEPSLIKFVFEHAAGKPTDKIDMRADFDISPIQIIKLPDNGRIDSVD
jgi:hypothetical protein